MKTSTCLLIALLSAALTFSAATAEQAGRNSAAVVPAGVEGLILHSLFQSNMVLQREKPITIWGGAVPGEGVTVSFAGQTQTAQAGADGSWKVVCQAMEATAEPLQMTIDGKAATITLDNILIGDVWVMGGQSNMQEPLVNLEGGPMDRDLCPRSPLQDLCRAGQGRRHEHRVCQQLRPPQGVVAPGTEDTGG